MCSGVEYGHNAIVHPKPLKIGPCAAECNEWVDNLNIPGFGTSSAPAQDKHSCTELCINNAECNAVAFEPQTDTAAEAPASGNATESAVVAGTCWLKTIDNSAQVEVDKAPGGVAFSMMYLCAGDPWGPEKRETAVAKVCSPRTTSKFLSP